SLRSIFTPEKTSVQECRTQSMRSTHSSPDTRLLIRSILTSRNIRNIMSENPMLIKEKLPGVYPQITHAPTNYVDFLNFFRGGHTIDDNLDVTKIAETMQAGMLRAAIASGHLTKVKNMAIPDESLA